MASTVAHGAAFLDALGDYITGTDDVGGRAYEALKVELKAADLEWLLPFAVVIQTQHHRINALENEHGALTPRLEGVEQSTKGALKDAGVWTGATRYSLGNVVSHAGSAWIAQTDSIAEIPGKSSAWRLAVKSGRDGRDLRA